MELMKELSVNTNLETQIYMILYMGSTPPNNLAELNAAIKVNDFCDMWNKSIGCAYTDQSRAAPPSVSPDYTFMLSPRAGTGQLKGGVNRMDSVTFAGTGYPIVPDTIALETASGVPITDSGWFGLFAANMFCRVPNPQGNGRGIGKGCVVLSPRNLTEFSPVGHMVLGFKSAKTLTGIQFNHYSGLPLQKFAVDYWSGNAWVECLALREGTQGWFAFTPQVTTTKVRVRLQAGASPVLAEVTDTFVLAELDAPVVEAVAAIRWALVIPISSRPTYSKASNTPIAFGVADGIIKRGTGIPFYAMSVAGPGGVADILVTKVSGLMTSDTPQPTGFYMQPGNLIEV